MRWDLFCRVIDNLGDAGVCWRLAVDLAARGEVVRLLIDRPQLLQRIAPDGALGVDVQHWHDDAAPAPDTAVVIEAFGCDPPPHYVQQMAQAVRPPVWINLEYLSAEAHAARSHALASPRLSDPGRGLTKWFYFPGFTAGTGGLLREPGQLERRAAFVRDPWLQQSGWPRRDGERVVVLFSYTHPGLPGWLRALATQPTLLLVPQGPAQRVVHEALGPALSHAALRAELLDWLPQSEFDRLLWAADLNVVRGEDSLVRALWAGAPLLWQLYPQHDGAHRLKLQALVEAWQAANGAPLAAGVAAQLAWWNAADGAPPPALPALDGAWPHCVTAWREQLARQPDLTTQLLGFVAARR